MRQTFLKKCRQGGAWRQEQGVQGVVLSLLFAGAAGFLFRFSTSGLRSPALDLDRKFGQGSRSVHENAESGLVLIGWRDLNLFEDSVDVVGDLFQELLRCAGFANVDVEEVGQINADAAKREIVGDWLDESFGFKEFVEAVDAHLCVAL